MNTRPLRATFPLLFSGLLATVLIAACSLTQACPAHAASQSYNLSFALGHPGSPQPADPLLPNTDLLLAPRWNYTGGDSHTFGLEPMNAQHGADCSPFPASHAIPYGTNLDQSFYVCHDHMMTALNAPDDQGVAAITPNALVDFSGCRSAPCAPLAATG